jgi:lipopolysaccharide transport system ATP-binding protein
VADGPVLAVDGLGKRLTSGLSETRRQGIADILSDLRGASAIRSELRTSEFWALRGISFEVAPGEALGVLGPNGAGKSTLLRVLHGVSRPSEGSVQIRGRHTAMLSLAAPFNRILSGYENIIVSATLHGVPKREMADIVAAVEDFSELDGEVLRAPLTTYSSGMQLRLGYAIAAVLPAELLLVDEVIAVGDLAFQRKCLAHVRRFLGQGGAVVLVTHDLWMVQALCRRAILLDHGAIEAEGPTNHVLSAYLRAARQQQYFVPRDRLGEPAAGDDAAIEVVSVVGASGGPIRNGDDVLVTIEAGAVGGGRATWRIDLLTANRQVCIARIRPPVDAEVIDVDGDGCRVTVRLRRLPLLPGSYFVDAHLHDAETGEVLGRSGTPCGLEVVSRHTRLDTLAQLPGAGALSTVEATYEIVGDAP